MKVESDRILKHICKAQDHFIKGNTSKSDVFDDLLAAYLDITDSEYGFIGEIFKDNRGAPFLSTISITNIAWNDTLYKIFSKRSGIKFTNLDTLFGLVINEKEIVISNNPSTDNRRGGTSKIPKGHPPLHRFCGIPIIIDNEMIGMIGVANSKEDYTLEKCLALSQLTNNCAILIRGYNKVEETDKILLGNKSRLSAISHEIRTPMNSIMGYAQLLQDEVSDDNKIFVNNIISNCGSILEIIDNVISINKDIEDIKLEDINLKNFIDKKISDLLGISMQMGVTINMLIPDNINILCDRFLLGIIISNLIGNALKYNRVNGIINIKVTMDPFELTIENTGDIIPENKRISIFDPYERLNTTVQGSGLGLSMVKEIAEKIKQRVYMTSDNIYNIFHFTFERSTSPVPEVWNILYVEDNENNISLMRTIFKKKIEKCNLEIARTGKEGLQKIDGKEYKILLLDLNLPDTTGFDIIKILNSKGIHIPVIIITADASDDTKKKVEKARIELITKPFNIHDVINKIKSYM